MLGPAGAGPIIPGLSNTEAPTSGKDLIGDLVAQMSGRQAGPRVSAGDKVAQAVQLLREAAQEDLRMAPLVNSAISSLVTGGSPGGQGVPPQGGIQGPVPQAQAGGGNPMASLASLMAGAG